MFDFVEFAKLFIQLYDTCMSTVACSDVDLDLLQAAESIAAAILVRLVVFVANYWQRASASLQCLFKFDDTSQMELE